MPLDEMCPVCGGVREDEYLVLCVGCRPLACEWVSGTKRSPEGEPDETYYARLNRQADERGRGKSEPDSPLRRLAAAVIKDAIHIVENEAPSGPAYVYAQAKDFLFREDTGYGWGMSRRMWCLRAGIDEAAMRERLPREMDRRRAEKKASVEALAVAKAQRARKRSAK
jgi:hypothetical protein